MARKGTFFLSFIFLSFQLYAQTVNQDSIKLLVDKAVGLQKAELLIKLCDLTLYNQTTLALNYANEAYSLADNQGIDSLKYRALNKIGDANLLLGFFDKAMEIKDSVLQYYTKTQDSIHIAAAYNDKALILKSVSLNSELIMEYNLKALKIREQLNDSNGIATSLNNIGTVYFDWKKYEKANEFFFRSLDYFELLKLNDESAKVLSNIGTAYTKLGDFENAEMNLLKAKDLYKIVTNKKDESELLIRLSNLRYHQGKLDEAIKILHEAIAMKEELQHREGLATCFYNEGYFYWKKGDLANAEVYFKKCLDLTNEMGIQEDLPIIYESLSKINRDQHDFESAYHYLLKCKAVEDSIFSNQQHQQLEELQRKYDFEKKESENILLKEENNNQQIILKKNRFILYLSMSIAFLFVLFLFVFFQRRRTVDQLKNLVSEQRLLRSQMNPHFIFNSVSAIQNYILSHSPKEAVNYLSAFASLMRQILENSSKEYVELEDELKWLKNYFSLQKLRYSNRFDYVVDIDNEMRSHSVLIPPMLTQPFIENAIEHGIKEMEEPGKIWLRYKIKGPLIQVEIEDNGIGILKSKKQKLAGHKSFAIEATKNRMKVLHKKEKTSMSFEVIDKSEQQHESKGTIVRFTLPFITRF